MVTYYIDKIEDLYSDVTETWYRDDIPAQIKRLILEGNIVRIVSSPLLEKINPWLNERTIRISDEDVFVLGYEEQKEEDGSTIITSDPESYPLHKTSSKEEIFGGPNLDISLPEVAFGINADILFIPCSYENAIRHFTTHFDKFSDINAAYITENESTLLQSSGTGRTIIFTSREHIVEISHAIQYCVNKLRNLGCHYHPFNKNKRVVITDGTIDEAFFDESISLLFLSNI